MSLVPYFLFVCFVVKINKHFGVANIVIIVVFVPFTGDHFDIDVYKPWEFNVTFPLRTALIPQLIVGVPYSLVNILSPHYSHVFGRPLRTPYVLLVLPRLVMCSLSFVSDYCLYKICCLYSQNYRVRLITYASSYVMLTYATHTFSNSIELVLVSLLLYYVSSCMALTEKVRLSNNYFSSIVLMSLMQDAPVR